METLTCRVLPYAEADGPGNMAADEVLLESAVHGVASLRFYGWTVPTLSLGYFQPAAHRQTDPRFGALPFVRRLSGGDALVHHHELTYALALPAGPSWQKRGESWIGRMHRIIRGVLGGASAMCAAGGEKTLGPILCFLHQTPCDVLVKGHKVVGSAQRKSRGALLQHGAILLAQSPHTPFLAGLHELAGFDPSPVSRAGLQNALITELSHDTAWTLAPGEWTAKESQRRAILAVEKYGSPLWNEKR